MEKINKLLKKLHNEKDPIKRADIVKQINFYKQNKNIVLK